MSKSYMQWEWEGKPYSYSITDDDYLNLARAVQFEGKPQNVILWTLLQRFAVLNSLGTYKNLNDFIKAYVQPINPRWFPTGDLHLTRLKILSTAGKKTEAKTEARNAQLRLNKAKYPLSNLTITSISTVDNVLSGGIKKSPAPESIHYWASRADSKMTQAQARTHNQNQKPNLILLDVGSGWLPGVNVFFSSPQIKGLKNLRFGKESSVKPSSLGSGVIEGIIGMGFFGYLAYKVWKLAT